MRVLLADFHLGAAKKINIISIPEPSAMTHSFYRGDGRRRRREKCRSACFGCFTDRAVSHAFPEWHSCPKRLDSCWLQLWDVFVSVCLSLIGVYTWRPSSCVFACWASDPAAQDVGLCWRLLAYRLLPSGILYTLVFINYIWMHTECVGVWVCVVVTFSSAAVKVLCSLSKPPQTTPPFSACFWWLPETSALHSVPVTRVSSLLKAWTQQQLNGAKSVAFSLRSLRDQPNIWTDVLLS